MSSKPVVIEHIDENRSLLAQRYPKNGELSIKWGSQLIVRENQTALFFKDGFLVTSFSAGRYVLTTADVPVITDWVTKFAYGPNNPFRAEIIFCSSRLVTGEKWGTISPIIVKDSEYGLVRIKAFGSFSYRVKEMPLFYNQLMGSSDHYTSKEATSYIRTLVLSCLNEIISSRKESVILISSEVQEIILLAKDALRSLLQKVGLELFDFTISNFTLPREVEEMLDTKTGINVLGNLNDYMKFQVANSLTNNAANSNPFLEAGTGLSLGMLMPQFINGAFNQSLPQNEAGKEDERKSIKARLAELTELLDAKLISEKEYDEKRLDIIKQV